jgi:hypothetical protein
VIVRFVDIGGIDDHKLSFQNSVLIALQNPTATMM